MWDIKKRVFSMKYGIFFSYKPEKKLKFVSYNILKSECHTHRIQIAYRMCTPIGANGKLLILNFHIDTGAATNNTNN